jgi:hypothetical protein
MSYPALYGGPMNQTRIIRHRRQRWLSPEKIQEKFAQLRAALRAYHANPVWVQEEFSFAAEPSVRRGLRNRLQA